MGWFGRKSAAVAPQPMLPVWAGAGEREAFPRSYQSRFTEVYVNNPVGQRAVRLVAGAVAALPVYVLEGKERAAELVSRPGLMEALAAQLLLHGNAYRTISRPRDGSRWLDRSPVIRTDLSVHRVGNSDARAGDVSGWRRPAWRFRILA